MARKTIVVCDDCGKRIDTHTAATMRLSFTDHRRNDKQADLCGECADRLPGIPVARRGRPHAALS